MFFTTATAQADFAEVSDADGYVNLRAEANTQSRVITRIGNGAFVYLVPPEAEPPVGDWVFVQYRNSKNQVQDGWLHQSRLRNIAQFPTMSHQASSRGFSCINQHAQLYVEMDKFDYAANKKHFGGKKLNDSYPILLTYKGKTMFGTDGAIPHTAYTAMTLVQNDNRHRIAPSAFEHLFNPYFEGSSKGIDHICTYDAKRKRIHYIAWNSDGAGTYAVLFVFENGKLREVLPMNSTFY